MDKLKPNELKVYNIGDCGYILFRPSGNDLNLIYRSENILKPKAESDSRRPIDIQYMQHSIQEDDILVVASDSLFYNLPISSISDYLESALS